MPEKGVTPSLEAGWVRGEAGLLEEQEVYVVKGEMEREEEEGAGGRIGGGGRRGAGGWGQNGGGEEGQHWDKFTRSRSTQCSCR